MIEKVKVMPVEDGGNPRTLFDIRRNGKKGFFIKPYSEDGDNNYKFRLNVKLINNNYRHARVLFIINWNDTEHQHNRNFVMIYKNDNYKKIEAEIDRTRTIALTEVPPGESHLCIFPPYNYKRLVNMLDKLPEVKFSKHIIGKSLNKRDIFAVETGQSDQRPIVVMTRVHPYETIGSYFADGMINWLTSDNEEVKSLLSKKRIVFIPMPNPDGVAEGLCKTTLGGLDYSYAASSEEPEAVSVKNYLTEINARGIFDLHGYMINHDRFRTNDGTRMDLLYKKLKMKPDLFNKKLFAYNEMYPINGKEINMGGHVVTKMNGTFINSSWTWYDRSINHVRSMGVEILKAYASLF